MWDSYSELCTCNFECMIAIAAMTCIGMSSNFHMSYILPMEYGVTMHVYISYNNIHPQCIVTVKYISRFSHM